MQTDAGPIAAMRAALRTGRDDAEANPLRYMEWLPSQWAFFHDTSPEKLLRTGNQIGKTTAGAAEVIWACLGEHPFNDTFVEPPVEWWVVCSSFQEAIVVQEKFWDLLPRHRVVSAPFEPKNGFGAKGPLILFDNGSCVDRQAVDT